MHKKLPFSHKHIFSKNSHLCKMPIPVQLQKIDKKHNFFAIVKNQNIQKPQPFKLTKPIHHIHLQLFSNIIETLRQTHLLQKKLVNVHFLVKNTTTAQVSYPAFKLVL